MSQNILDTHPDPILHKVLKSLRNQGNELAPGLPIVFRSAKKLCNGFKIFSQYSKSLIECSQLLGQIINSLHPLHKISVSTKPNQVGTSKLFFSTSLYLFGPIMARPNQYLQYQSEALVCLFEGLNKIIEENQVERSKK
jgi:hypothetical protein